MQLMSYSFTWRIGITLAPQPMKTVKKAISSTTVLKTMPAAPPVLLEVAEAWANTPDAPRRTVGFLAVTAEESGLLGSQAYVAKPQYPMNKTVAGINMDGLNFRGKMSDVVVVGYGGSQMEDILADVASESGRTITPEATPEKGYYYRSDHFNFAKKGVPILYARGGTTDREHGAEYVKQRNADYIAERYHAPGDEIQEDWDLDAAIEDLQLYLPYRSPRRLWRRVARVV